MIATRFWPFGLALMLVVTLPAPGVGQTPAAGAASQLLREGTDALVASEYTRAASLFRDISAHYPKSTLVPQALYWRGYALYRLGNAQAMRDGLDALRRLQADFPLSSLVTRGDAETLRIRLLTALAQRGDSGAAFEVARRAQEEVAKRAPGGQDAPRVRRNRAMADAPLRSPMAPPGGPDCRKRDDDIAVAALNALVQMDPERAQPVVERVLRQRDEGSVCLRRVAILIQGDVYTSELEPLLIDVAENDPDDEVQKQAVAKLIDVESSQALRVAQAFIKRTPKREAARQAVNMLIASPGLMADIGLRAYSERDDLDPLQLRWVIDVLADRRNPENVAALRPLFTRTRDGDARRAILLVFADQEENGDAGAGAWLTALYSPTLDAMSRKTLVAIYRGMQRPAMMDAAIDRLVTVAKQDPDPALRKEAVEAITEFGGAHAAEALQKLVEQRPSPDGRDRRGTVQP